MSDKSEKVIKDIIDNYKRNEANIVNQLYFTTNHGTTIGGFREDIWREMFEQIIPRKFVIEQSVFIIDSEGNVSNEVDLAIFDETYTPYIFRYGRLKFLPIEAVAVVVECKSTSLKPTILKEWGESIEKLKTSSLSYVRIAGKIARGEEVRDGTTQTATRPLRILCKLNERLVRKKFESGNPLFDIEISASEKNKKLKILYREKNKTLQDWYLQLNHVNLSNEIRSKINAGETLNEITLSDYQVNNNGKEVSLLSLNLQLNQLLMLINNPMFFPHKAYVDLFNGRSNTGGKAIDEQSSCSDFY